MNARDRWVTLIDNAHQMHVGLIQSMLESNDIPVSLPDEHGSSVVWQQTLLKGGVTIQVMATDYDRAVELVEEAENQPELDEDDFIEAYPEEEVTEETQRQCPECGSDLAKGGGLRHLIRVLYALIVFGPGMGGSVWRCDHCGWWGVAE